MTALTYPERMALRDATASVDAADAILRSAALGVQHIDEPLARLATHVGRLQGEVRRLCAEMADADDTAPCCDCVRYAVSVHGIDVGAWWCGGTLHGVGYRGADISDLVRAIGAWDDIEGQARAAEAEAIEWAREEAA